MNCKLNFKKVFLNEWLLPIQTSLEFCWRILLMSLKLFFKKLKVTEDFISPGCLLINLKTLILNIIVFLWIFCLLTIFINFSFSRNWLNTFTWWSPAVIIPFLFVRRISSYSFITSATSSGFSIFSAFSFSAYVSVVSLFTRECISCSFTSSSLSRSVFLTFSKPLYN